MGLGVGRVRLRLSRVWALLSLRTCVVDIEDGRVVVVVDVLPGVAHLVRVRVRGRVRGRGRGRGT